MRADKPVPLMPGQLPLWEVNGTVWHARCVDCRWSDTGEPHAMDLAANRHQRATGHVQVVGVDIP